MEVLYHRVPTNMSGTILYPLNELKKLHPELYAEHVKKYEGREQLLTTEVPPLECLWNDVLHFTAVAPSELKANLAKADTELAPVAWFKVPISLIEGEFPAARNRRSAIFISACPLPVHYLVMPE